MTNGRLTKRYLVEDGRMPANGLSPAPTSPTFYWVSFSRDHIGI